MSKTMIRMTAVSAVALGAALIGYGPASAFTPESSSVILAQGGGAGGSGGGAGGAGSGGSAGGGGGVGAGASGDSDTRPGGGSIGRESPTGAGPRSPSMGPSDCARITDAVERSQCLNRLNQSQGTRK